MRFEFATASRIVFGPGTFDEIGPLAAGLLADSAERRALVVTRSAPGFSAELVDRLATEGVTSTCISVEGEPTTDAVQAATQQARDEGCSLVIGFGGGSCIDTAKAVSALLTNDGDLLDYLEVIGQGQPLTLPAAPCIAIPSTAGTGAEVTRNAVLASPEHRVKVSLRSPLMLPRIALVDSRLMLKLPPAVTASTGLDALTQLIEPYVSVRANPMTDGFCREGMARAARSLRRAFDDGSDSDAREDMALASLLGGLALANAGLGAVHGFAAPVGGMFHAPHGAVCAALLPHVMETNLHALRQREADNPVLARYHEVGCILTGRPDATAEDGVTWLRDLRRHLEIPGLGRYGANREHVETLVEKASAASSMRGNPIRLTDDELRNILERAL